MVEGESAGTGGRTKIILGTVDVEYIYSFARPTLIIFTPLNILRFSARCNLKE
jgi:hypothetical protein